MDEIQKHPEMIVRSRDPYNAGPPPGLITREYTTPNGLFFVRNHAPVPQIVPGDYRLLVGGLVDRPYSLSLRDLDNAPRFAVDATLQCAGNRRTELFALADVPGEIPWGDEAISHAVWSGVRLRDLLERANLRDGAKHVEFVGLDRVEKAGETFGFGGSIPIEKAMGEEVLLATEMNGEPLPPTHGYPVRCVVPGYIGARSVKWIGAINVQAEPSRNYYQARAYRLFPGHIDATSVDWDRGLPLGELSVNSAIVDPQPAQHVSAGPVKVTGYATAGGTRHVARVDVSPDGGETWIEAELTEMKQWSWCFWEATVDLAAGEHTIVSRAWDSAGNSQPQSARQTWNFKGYMNNAWSRAAVSAG
jgi:sulfite oxidase